MILIRAFLYSLKLPDKQAMFRLNRTGMDITIFYMLILLMFISLPSLTNQLSETTSVMTAIYVLIYFLIFYYLPLTVIVFLFISIMAYTGTWIARLLRRKVTFSILWKTCVYTTTIPFTLYTIIAFIFTIHDIFLGLFIIYLFLFMLKIITVYPKRKIKK